MDQHPQKAPENPPQIVPQDTKDPQNFSEHIKKNSHDQEEHNIDEVKGPVRVRRHSETQDADSDQDIKNQKQEQEQPEVVKIKKITVGVCAMEKKSSSKPMQKILRQMECPELEIIVFPEDVILNKEIKNWPKVDALIAWYSDGFPLKKCQNYVNWVQPFQINDVFKQELLWDRTAVYDLLKSKNVQLPKNYYVRRTNENIKDKYYKIEEQLDHERTQKRKIQEIQQKKYQVQNDQNIIVENRARNVSFSSMKNYELNKNSNNQLNFSPLSTHSVHSSINPQYQNKLQQEKTTSDPKQIFLHKQNSNIQEVSKNSLNGKNNSNGNSSNNNNPSNNSIKTKQQGQQQQQKIRRSKSLQPSHKYKYHRHKEQKKVQELQKDSVQEYDDFIVIGNKKLKKPFVEKPFDAEDHNIYIYYDQADGGGCKKLFRKINNQSSIYDKDLNTIRKTGDYIYEKFLPTDGFDIKVYTVGTDYSHAESRKAPALDGKVIRKADGKEVRYPVSLTFDEKAIARNIVKLFGQQICGFDLLRSNGKSYVCDVNGWSFVKGNEKYIEDCAYILKDMILKKFKYRSKNQQLTTNLNLKQFSMRGLQTNQYRPANKSEVPQNSKEELRSIVAIFRHGDRTPKQKMKMKVVHPKFIQYFIDRCNECNKPWSKEIKVKNPKNMQRFLDTANEVFQEMLNKMPLKKKGSVNIDQQSYDKFQNSTKDDSVSNQPAKTSSENDFIEKKLEQLIAVLKLHGSFEGFYRKIQIKPIDFQTEQYIKQDDSNSTKSGKNQPQKKPTKLLIILKWGGELTHAGEEQAKELGATFRVTQYPIEKEGLLRLHNTYRHDLKTYTSDEGRCQKTAGHFIRGLLDYEGDVASIVTTLLTRNETSQKLLDVSHEGPLQIEAKQQISFLLNSDKDLYTHYKETFKETAKTTENMKQIMLKIGNPKEKLQIEYQLVSQLESLLYQKSESRAAKKSYYIREEDYNLQQDDDLQLCQGENINLLFKRWRKLKVDFKLSDQEFNVSKLPDIYDNIKYDLIHNTELILGIYPKAQELFSLAQLMASFIVPSEFGLTEDKKLDMSQEVIGPLCDKIKTDLTWWKTKNYQEDFWKYKKDYKQEVQSTWRHVRSRLYFTNASHISSLFDLLIIGLAKKSNLISKEKLPELEKIKSLQYLSHIVFRLYEDLTREEQDENRFRLELSLSPGCEFDKIESQTSDHKVLVKDLIPINIEIGINEMEQFFDGINYKNKGQQSKAVVIPEKPIGLQKHSESDKQDRQII